MKRESLKANSYKIKIAVILLLIVCSGTLVTYGAFYTIETQSDTNSINAGCLSTTYEDGDSISLTAALPLTDSSGLASTPYTFTLTNTCTIESKYYVIINTKSGSFSPSYLKVSVDGSTSSILSDNTVNTLVSYDSDTYSSSYIVATGTLAASAAVTYNVRLWLDEDVTYSQVSGSSWEGQVQVSSRVNSSYQ